MYFIITIGAFSPVTVRGLIYTYARGFITNSCLASATKSCSLKSVTHLDEHDDMHKVPKSATHLDEHDDKHKSCSLKSGAECTP